jgi:hypothetical protein
VGPGIPAALLPALGARLASRIAEEALRPARRGRAWEVRLADGALLGRGAHAAQARGRALALAASALAAAPGAAAEDLAARLGPLDGAWRALAPRLARPPAGPALLVAVEAAPAERPGPPYDVLNRGPDRAFEVDGALAVRIAPGHRAAARRLPPGEAVRALLAAAGGQVEVVPASGDARPAAARLAQLARILRVAASAPAAVEAGGAVYVAHVRGARRFAAERFALRPRRVAADPEAPDLATSPRTARGARAPVVYCRVAPAASGAALLLCDAEGTQLRDPVALAEVEERLEDARAVLRTASPPAVLALQLSDAPSAHPRGRSPRIEVAVRGDLRRLEVEIAGERFGGGAQLGWRDAALAVLGAAPALAWPRLAVRDVRVTDGGQPVSSIVALWAASVARRRLHTFLRISLATYRVAAAGR